MPIPGADTGYHRWLRVGLVVFLTIALFFLWEEHRAHLLGALPWLLLLLACPLMHMLMHRRHGGHHQGGAPASDEKSGETNKGQRHGGHGCC